MLQRIYGTAWESKKALDEHLHRLEEAEKRDHRKLGVELDLFSFPEEIGSGLAVFHPKGGIVRRVMEDYSRAAPRGGGYEFVNSPHITKANLFETSATSTGSPTACSRRCTRRRGRRRGHDYYLKPMNCPFHILIYRSRTRSYRELPLRLFEFGTVYRYEKSGVVHGLTRVRGMTQDDAHIFCTKEQMVDELASLLDFVLDLLRDYGLDDFYLELSTKPEGKAVGTDEEWDEATEALRVGGVRQGPRARDGRGRRRVLRPEDLGAGARRDRPHVADVDDPARLPDCRSASTSQYVGADNERHRPVMIHRALFGSIERFFAVLARALRGRVPAVARAGAGRRCCRSPTATTTYAFRVVDRLKADGFRAEMVDGASRRARRAHPPGQDREGAVRARRRRRRRRARHRRREQAGERRARARRHASTTSSSASRPRSPSTRDAHVVSLERLWAGWRADVRRRRRHRPAAEGRVRVLRARRATDDDEALVLERTEHDVRGDERCTRTRPAT